jgi:hypothetical protein
MRRSWCAILLIYEALFLNVFIPAHTRGIVQLPGSHAGMACCCDTGESRGEPKKTPTDKEKQNRVENCAICAFAARLTIPPTIDLTLPPLLRLGLIEQLSPRRIELPAFPLRYHGRAPPMLHV